MDMDASDNHGEEQVLFVVQRCWFAGPNVVPPMDYRRLFRTAAEAEESAYHSAHAWNAQHSSSSEIKTLLLPASSSREFTSCCHHGFVANGGSTLFWIRSVRASVVALESTTTNPLSSAHVILTEGVIGGTGNRHSRRGMEVDQGRVFLGIGSGQAAWTCCQTLQQQQSFTTTNPPHYTYEMALVPIGKPKEYQSTLFLQDWPADVLRPQQGNSMQDDHPPKRGPSSLENSTAVAGPLTPIPVQDNQHYPHHSFHHVAKRTRRCAPTSSTTITTATAMEL